MEIILKQDVQGWPEDDIVKVKTVMEEISDT